MNIKMKIVFKILFLLVALFFTGNVFAYSSMTTQELLNKKQQLTSELATYQSNAKRYEALAATYRYKTGLAATNMFILYNGQSMSWTNKAINASADLERINNELARRSSSGGSSSSSNSANNSTNSSSSNSQVRRTVKKFTIKKPAVISAGSSVTLACFATFSDGTKGRVMPTTWSNTSYGYVKECIFYSNTSAAGKSVKLTATFGGKKATVTIKVAKLPKAVKLKKLKILSSGTRLSCQATYSDKTTKTVTPQWVVSKPQYAQVSNEGVLTLTSAGASSPKSFTFKVYAHFGGKKASSSWKHKVSKSKK